jgi:hypothetical protein
VEGVAALDEVPYPVEVRRAGGEHDGLPDRYHLEQVHERGRTVEDAALG